MREIKFRAWNKENKKMIYPKYEQDGQKHQKISLMPDGSGHIQDCDEEDYPDFVIIYFDKEEKMNGGEDEM